MIDHDTPLSKKIEKKKIIAKLLKKAKQQTENHPCCYKQVICLLTQFKRL